MPQHVLDIWKAPVAALQLDDASRRKFAASITTTHPSVFPALANAHRAPITFLEESFVVAALFLCIGGPLYLLLAGLYLAALSTYTNVGIWLAVTLLLALHPLPTSPSFKAWVLNSAFSVALYRYFSYRFIWSGNSQESNAKSSAFIGAGPPHGVLPFANLLSIPAINQFAFRPFVGAPASVVFHTPFLRYITCFGCCDVGARSISEQIDQGVCVGMVPDGTAGIFQVRHDVDVVNLKHRKGLARLALRRGIPLLPAYSVGNTEVFSALYDPWGIMEYVSRKLKVSIFIPYGRFLLPIPKRSNITMIIGDVIPVEKVENPTQAQIDELHERLINETKIIFDTHKHSLGWGSKELKFV
jgi:2-acylglycerol O-acyltransferase 2